MTDAQEPLSDVGKISSRLSAFGLANPEYAGMACEALETITALQAKLVEAERLINTPHIEDFVEAVKLEAAHQVKRWGSDHDAGKSAPDWFWLLGYLAGKAVQADKISDLDKMKHHIITTAAACLNWHRHVSGDDGRMRPGIMPPGDTTPSKGGEE